MSVTEGFPTPLWRSEANNAVQINQEFLNLIPKLRADSDNGVSRSNSGGWHSAMLKFDELPIFKDSLMEFIAEVNADLNITAGTSIVVDSMWINVNTKTHYNRTHTHPNSMISGVYYVSVPKDSGEIVFVDPRPQTAIVPLPVDKKNKYTTIEIRHQPQVGTFIAFPSWMPHHVEASENEEERISVAFNIALMAPRKK